MALITSVTLPVAYIMMRKLLAAQYSWDRWDLARGEQYFRCLPAIYYGIVQRIFAAPVVAANGKARYHREVVKSLKFVLPAVAAASFTVWLLPCDFAIWLLLSNKFTAMRDLFAWRLTW